MEKDEERPKRDLRDYVREVWRMNTHQKECDILIRQHAWPYNVDPALKKEVEEDLKKLKADSRQAESSGSSSQKDAEGKIENLADNIRKLELKTYKEAQSDRSSASSQNEETSEIEKLRDNIREFGLELETKVQSERPRSSSQMDPEIKIQNLRDKIREFGLELNTEVQSYSSSPGSQTDSENEIKNLRHNILKTELETDTKVETERPGSSRQKYAQSEIDGAVKQVINEGNFPLNRNLENLSAELTSQLVAKSSSPSYDASAETSPSTEEELIEVPLTATRKSQLVTKSKDSKSKETQTDVDDKEREKEQKVEKLERPGPSNPSPTKSNLIPAEKEKLTKRTSDAFNSLSLRFQSEIINYKQAFKEHVDKLIKLHKDPKKEEFLDILNPATPEIKLSEMPKKPEIILLNDEELKKFFGNINFVGEHYIEEPDSATISLISRISKVMNRVLKKSKLYDADVQTVFNEIFTKHIDEKKIITQKILLSILDDILYITVDVFIFQRVVDVDVDEEQKRRDHLAKAEIIERRKFFLRFENSETKNFFYRLPVYLLQKFSIRSNCSGLVTANTVLTVKHLQQYLLNLEHYTREDIWHQRSSMR